MHDNTTQHVRIAQIRNWIWLYWQFKKGAIHLKIALIFTRHFYFKGIATKAYVADYGISHAESLRFAFLTLYNYQFYDS